MRSFISYVSLVIAASSIVFSSPQPATAQSLQDRATNAVAAITGQNKNLTQVTKFDHQVTGVAVTETGRIFVNFPRWTEDAPISVAELGSDGKLTPYPDEEWNKWRNAAPLQSDNHFVCVQAVFADQKGSLWVVDPAAPNSEKIVPNGPKLVRIDLASNKVGRVYMMGPDAAPQGSYLNDVRISPDGKTAYMTNSGAPGSLVVLDLDSGKARNVLSKHPSTQPEPDVKVAVEGRELRRPDGRGVQFAADSIALDPQGQYLYWQALTGKTSYRIATSVLRDENASPDQVAAKVESVGETFPTDGYWMDKQGRLFLTSITDNSVKMRAGDGSISTLVQDERLHWPDTFSQGADGTLYVTTSDIQSSPWFNEKGWTRKGFALWKIAPDDAAANR